MAQEMVVLKGQSFTIDLQSRFGSTNYLWALTGLPQGILLKSISTRGAVGMVGNYTQSFEFGAIAETKEKVEIEFTLISYTDLTQDQKYTVIVKVIPSDSDAFVKLRADTNPALTEICNSIQPYGVLMSSPETVLKYGYPSDAQEAIYPHIKYGYPCRCREPFSPLLKYGYPCRQEDPYPYLVKYGYPCGVQDTVNENCGDSCGQTDPIVKYGYPCGVQDAVNVKYGYPSDCQDPCSPVLKYGYPCKEDPNPYLVKYGYPCGVQDAVNVKYGYPRASGNAAVMYGFKCDSQNTKG